MNHPSRLPMFPIPKTLRAGALSLAAGLVAVALTGCATEEHVHVRASERVYRDPGGPPADEPAALDDDPNTPPSAEVLDTYHQDLDNYGTWVEVSEHGRCWRPRDVDREWRPYSRGHWVYSDYGWTWEADAVEVGYGSVVYHYGRWYEDPREGWLWVPGTTWGPAWVAWREGGGYCGWAPLPPTARFGVGVSITFGDIPADRFRFCETRFLGEPRVYDHYVSVRENTTIINKTTNITNITYVNNHVVNHGVDVRRYEQESHHPVQRVSVREVSDREEARRLREQGQPVAYVPKAVRAAQEQRQAQRERVQRRTADETASQRAERGRVQRRNANETAAQRAERERVQRRNGDETAAQRAERERVQRRNTQETAAQRAERERVQRRTGDETAAQRAERERAQRRTTDEAAAQREREQRRATDAEKARQAERERVLQRQREETAQPRSSTPAREHPTSERPTAERRPVTPAASDSRAAERERVARRAGEAPAPAQTEAEKQAERERVLRRQREGQ